MFITGEDSVVTLVSFGRLSPIEASVSYSSLRLKQNLGLSVIISPAFDIFPQDEFSTACMKIFLASSFVSHSPHAVCRQVFRLGNAVK